MKSNGGNGSRSPRPIRSLIISTSDIGHGAGVAAFRQHLGLLKLGVESNMLVSEKLSDDPHVHLARTDTGSLPERLNYMVEERLNRVGLQNIYSVAAKEIMGHPLVEQAQIVHLHNLHWHNRNFSPAIIPELCRNRKVVWTLHDMWPFTGHCIYSEDCHRWKTGCGQCPNLDSYIPLEADTTAALWLEKKQLYGKSRFVVVSPSRWLADLASQSPLFEGQRLEVIPNGIDTEIFRPMPGGNARDAIGLPATELVVVAYVSHDLSDKRKGYAYFEAAMMNLQALRSKVLILVAGRGSVSPKVRRLFKVHELGYISDAARLAQAYSAADMCVVPSLHENLPNCVLESMACGTPVVAFRTGGIPDIINHLKNGYIVESKDWAGLSEGIAYLATRREHWKQFEANALKTIAERFTKEIQAQNYLELYRQLLEEAI